MKNLLYILLITFGVSNQIFSQEVNIIPGNKLIQPEAIKNESSEMIWYFLQDTNKVEIGRVFTDIKKNDEDIVIITTVKMKQNPSKWIDSTIVRASSLKPIYHSSYNSQRDMVLNFGKDVTGYYLNKQTGKRITISEKTKTPYFDSNFYPQLVRWLPLKEGFSSTISIFDYNPKTKIGVMTATIKSVSKSVLSFNGEKKQIWKVVITDDISNNSAINTFYIDIKTRKILRQGINANGRKMLMELVE